MPEINQIFEVPRPVPTVWSYFNDVPQVVECMPGVELLDDLGGGAFKGNMKVKVGSIAANFQGEARVTETDEARYVRVISARGVDRQGGSRASAKVRYTLSESADGTKVEIDADISLQGALARFGRAGIIREVSARLTQEFAGCLRTKLTAPTPDAAAKIKAAEIKGLHLMLQSLWAFLKRLFSRNG